MKHAKKILLAAVYLALAVPMFYFTEEGVAVGSFSFMYMYLFGIGIVAFAVLVFFVSPDIRRGILSVRYMTVMSFPYLWTILYSLLFWILTLAEFRVITRGFFYVVYQLIAVSAAAATLYLFGNNGIYYQFFALAAANAIVIVQTVRQFGAGEFVSEYIDVITSFTSETGVIMKLFESMEHGFAIGFFLIFFLLDFRKNKKRLFWLPLAVFLFLLGLKRIILAAAAAGILLGVFGIRFLKKNAKRNILILLTGVGILGFAYIVAVRMGLYEWLEARGMDSMGRRWIYDMVRDWYEIGPGYFGKGAGYISGSISIGELDLTRSDGYAVADIHNDLLRQYIELGFLGYFIWTWLFLNRRAGYFFHAQATEDDRRHGILAAAVLAALFFTFMTDNTIYYYYTTIFSSIAIMGFRYEEYAEQVKLPGDDGS